MQIKEGKIDQEYIEKPVVLTSKWYWHYNKAHPSNANFTGRSKTKVTVRKWKNVSWLSCEKSKFLVRSPKRIYPFCTMLSFENKPSRKDRGSGITKRWNHCEFTTILIVRLNIQTNQGEWNAATAVLSSRKANKITDLKRFHNKTNLRQLES